MVTAVLSHNPYLLETQVLFNGRAPRINSAIKKYESQPLADWVREVPRIFNEEMNGYDFDLMFSGTQSDFDNIVQAFQANHVPENAVRVIHKGKLGAADIKREQVQKMLSWLKDNPNKLFDHERFISSNPDLYENRSTLILLHSVTIWESSPFVNIEPVDDVRELDDVDLSDTPIVLFISPDTADVSYGDLSSLLDRDDIAQNQLFFAIHPELNEKQVLRVLSDLGVAEPRAVSSIDDSAILKYLREYPVTSYVRDAISVCSAEIAQLSSDLRDNSEVSEQSGEKRRAEIDKTEAAIDSLRDTSAKLSNYIFGVVPKQFSDIQWLFFDSLDKWRAKKRKIEGEAEAKLAADELEYVARQALNEFIANLDVVTESTRLQIANEVSDIYREAKVDVCYIADSPTLPLTTTFTFPNLKEDVLNLKEVVYVDQKPDFFAFFNPVEPDENGQVMVTTYYLDTWRLHAQSAFGPILTSLVSSRSEALQSYCSDLVNTYQEHIAVLLAEKQANKESMVGKLSDEEKAIQADFDWLATFKDMLQEIKRG